MDWVLTSFNFAKCYINDIIVLNFILGNPMQHLQKVFGKLKRHNLNCILANVDFFKFKWNTWGIWLI
jgi:hypothetical protein